jgi:hypothetical protein
MTSWPLSTGKEKLESGLVATIFSFGNLLDNSDDSVSMPPAYAKLTLASSYHHKWTLARVYCPNGISPCKEDAVTGWQAGHFLDVDATAKEKIKNILNERRVISVPRLIGRKVAKTLSLPLLKSDNVLSAAYAMKNKDHTATIYTCWY